MDTQSHCPVSLPSFAELLLSIDSPSVRPLSVPSDSEPPSGATSQVSHVKKITQGRSKKRKKLSDQGESYRQSMTIGMPVLPDDVLLEVFDFCRRNHDYARRAVWEWHLLVHVCRSWRQIIFESRHRLILQIFCTHDTPVRKNLSIWPSFPISIDYDYSRWGITPNDEDNVIAALKHPNRVCFLDIRGTGSQLGKLATAMQEPFPVLTHLSIISRDGNAPVLPAEFLGGRAPSLQEIHLHGIPFSVPTPLLSDSTSDLSFVDLNKIPPTGYISPEAMVAFLAALPRLRLFFIKFQSATPRPDRISSPPVTRTVLPALASIRFQGASEYLEDLVARIDSPQLNRMWINYFNQLVDFQVSQLSKFINRSLGPELTLLTHAHVTFFSHRIAFHLDRYHTSDPYLDRRPASTDILCEGVDWQVSHMAQVLSHFSATLFTVIHLRLKVHFWEDRSLEGTEDVEWLLLLHQFSTLKTLHVSRELAGHVALALEDITGEMVTDALPSLDLIFLAGQPASSIKKFLTVRQLSGNPVTVVDTETEFHERLGSYVGE